MRLDSTRIANVEYDDDTEELEVTFHKGGVYRYHAVSQAVYGQLIASTSPGTYLDTHIKGKYEFTRVG